MGIPLRWAKSTDALQSMADDLQTPQGCWPAITLSDRGPAKDLMAARQAWAQRLRAHFLTSAQAAQLLQGLHALGAPLDIITGAAYVAEESTRLWAATTHVATPLRPPTPLTIDKTAFSAPPHGDALAILGQALNLLAFNLPISVAIYEALAAITDHDAIAAMCAAIAKSLGELAAYGAEALPWLVDEQGSALRRPLQAITTALMARHEHLCRGSTARLDALAGDAIVIEVTANNLGTLSDDTLAAIYYDRLATSVFPFLARLQWDGLQLWQQRHQASPPTTTPAIVAMAAVGIEGT